MFSDIVRTAVMLSFRVKITVTTLGYGRRREGGLAGQERRLGGPRRVQDDREEDEGHGREGDCMCTELAARAIPT